MGEHNFPLFLTLNYFYQILHLLTVTYLQKRKFHLWESQNQNIEIKEAHVYTYESMIYSNIDGTLE